MSKKLNQLMNLKAFAIFLSILIFIYLFPKILVSVLGPDNPWTSYFYMYGFGFVSFLIGMVLIVKTKALDLKRGNERFWFHCLIGGFLFFSAMHGIWIILALHYPYKGGM